MDLKWALYRSALPEGTNAIILDKSNQFTDTKIMRLRVLGSNPGFGAGSEAGTAA